MGVSHQTRTRRRTPATLSTMIAVIGEELYGETQVIGNTSVCVAGERACPPEDVGGVWGYAEFLKAIRNPKHAEHAHYLEWIGGAFDPEAFDLDAVNAALASIRS